MTTHPQKKSNNQRPSEKFTTLPVKIIKTARPPPLPERPPAAQAIVNPNQQPPLPARAQEIRIYSRRAERNSVASVRSVPLAAANIIFHSAVRPARHKSRELWIRFSCYIHIYFLFFPLLLPHRHAKHVPSAKAFYGRRCSGLLYYRERSGGPLCLFYGTT